MKKIFNVSLSLFFVSTGVFAQNKGLVANSESPYSKLQSVGLQDVKWTNGFWKEQFDVETKNTLPYMWDLYHNETSHAYKNFEIAKYHAISPGIDTRKFVPYYYTEADNEKHLEEAQRKYWVSESISKFCLQPVHWPYYSDCH